MSFNARLVDIIVKKRKSLLTYLRSRVKTAQDAEEVFQDACMVALRYEGEDIRDMDAWFFRILSTRSLNKHRSDKPKVEIDKFEMPLPICDFDKDYHTSLVKQHIHVLPKKQRQAIEFRINYDKKFTELSEEFGIKCDTLKANYRHGVLALREELKEFM